MTIFHFVFKRYFRKPSNIIFLLILPIASVFLPVGEWPPIPMGFQYYGILLLFIAIGLARIIMEDRTNKVLIRMGVAPITHFQYLWQNLLAYSLILIGLNLVVVTVGIIVHGEVLNSPLLLFVIYSFFSITALGFALAWYSLFSNMETAISILTGVIVLMAMMGGIMWPIHIMPVVFQKVAMLLPTYWLAEAVTLVAYGAPTVNLILPLGMMVMFSIAFLLLGSRRRMR